jgi:HPt (histidine-containing phosphotransfer) domain-containing protein
MENEKKDPASLAFNPEFLLSQVDQDRGMLRELLLTFQRTYSEKIEELRAAIEQKDAKKMMEAAHYLKGDLGTMGHPPATEIAQKLESLGHEGTIVGASDLLSSLEAAAKPIFKYIESGE